MASDQLQVLTVPALQDNACYILHRSGAREALVIDPSQAAPIRRALAHANLELVQILNTHHHHDHVGGNQELHAETGAPIACSQRDLTRVPGATRDMVDGQIFTAAGIELEVLEIPGHTQGQIAFYHRDRENGALFAGDTLFAMGCGRLLEGTPQQMLLSLQRLMQLPVTTRLYFGHEYTRKNAQFARSVDPSNERVQARALRAEALGSGEILPAPRLADELLVNPFLRISAPEIRAELKMERASDLDVFTRLREMRDRF